MNTIVGLLVGMHFRPPAKTVLANLPAGVELKLSPELDNPYDEHAVQVLISPKAAIPEERYDGMIGELCEYGLDLQTDVLEKEELHLGYLAKTGNKVLEKTAGGPYAGNREILEAALGNADWAAQLSFSADGKALVVISYGKTLVEINDAQAPSPDDAERALDNAAPTADEDLGFGNG